MPSGKYARARKHVRHVVVILCGLAILGTLGTGVSWGVSALSRLPSQPSGAAAQPPASSEAASESSASESKPESVPETTLESTPESKPVSLASVSIDPLAPAYQRLYPELYVTDRPEFVEPDKKTVYLTFDDGPSNLTIPLLDVLDKYNVKATFFMVGKSGDEDLKAMREVVERGHAIGIHSYSHDYPKIYSSVEAYLDDFKKERDLIFNATGVEPVLYRYPGGSVNSYNKKTAAEITTEMNRRGYLYYDWNIDSGDATHAPTPQSIYNAAVAGCKRYDKALVLCHNTSAKKYTLEMMPKIIETVQALGCTFAKLDQTVEPYCNFPIPK